MMLRSTRDVRPATAALTAACEAVMQSLETRMLFTVWTPSATGLQSAINSAQLGDTILLDPNTTYVGTFTLKNKATGTGWITIQSAALGNLPENIRVTPDNAANMPIIRSPGFNGQAIKTEDFAHNYKLLGLQIVGPANNTDLVTLVEIGNDAQNTAAQVPHDIVIDRCYMRPNQPSANIRRAIGLHGSYVDITNSYIEEIHEGSDSNAIAGWNGLGHFNIINNHLEGAGENIMFGGATNRMPQPISDVVIRGNHVIKPLHWRDGSHGYKPSVKNLFELKQGARFTVEDNIFENCWVSGQTGVAIVLKLGDYDVSPQNVTEDIMIRNNIIRHAYGSVALQGRDYASNSPEGLVRRLSFINNLFDDINGKWGTSGTGGGTFNIYLTHGPKDVTFDHNTFLNGYTAIEVDENSATYGNDNFKFRNNIVDHNDYGVRSPVGTDDPTFTAYLNDGAVEWTKNVVVNTPWIYRNKFTTRPGNYLLTNSTDADTWAQVGFESLANHNFRLAPASIYNNAGTDGKDVGADIDQVTAEFAYTTGTTLNVRFDLITDAPRPITLDASGSSITAMYDGEILPFTGITAINVVGSAGADNLLLDGTCALPMSFSNGGGNDDVNVINQAGEVWTFQSDIGGAARNVAVTVAANSTAVFNATQRLRNLNVAGGATLSQGGSKMLITKGLSVSGRLDLKDNDLLLDYSGTPSPLGTFSGANYTGVLGLIASGYNFGGFNGNGLVTTMSQAASGLTTLGAGNVSDIYGIGSGDTISYQGETIDGSTVLVKYTYAGDANLDGTIDGGDYGIVDNYAQVPGASGYFNGDFNYDGVIDGGDYGIIDNNMQAQGGAL